MIQRLKTLVRTGQPSDPDATFDGTTTVDVQDLFFRFTIDIFTLVAFGVELRSFQRDDQHPFAKAFDHMQTRIIERVPNPCWRLSRCLGCSAVERDIQRNAAIIDTFANEVIAQKRRAATNGTTTTGGTTNGTSGGTTDGTEELGPDLISRFLTNNAKQHLKDDGTPPMTNTELRDIVLNFMIAGRDTTACALTWCMYVVLCRGLLSGFVVGVCCPRRVLPLTRCFFVLVVVVVVVLVLVFLVLSVFSVLSVCLSLFVSICFYLFLLVSTCFYLFLLVSTCFYLFLLVSTCLHLSPFVSIHSVCLCLSLPVSA